MARMQERYRQEIVPKLMTELGGANRNRVPRLTKIVVNVGVGEALEDAKKLDAAAADLGAITGQKPVIRRAHRAVANFKLQAGQAIGCSVTLRGRVMYEFLDRLLNVALPRVRDFRGVSDRSFDGRGNYTLGLKEQIIFPEIEYDKVDKLRGMNVTIVTTARTDAEARALLAALGMPFVRKKE